MFRHSETFFLAARLVCPHPDAPRLRAGEVRRAEMAKLRRLAEWTLNGDGKDGAKPEGTVTPSW
ncbi:hypothetical protein K32_01610 [Kaistia sp. 32K]|nr:hypothetical protein K32_01610 [Kaistia sp. 32K]